MNSPVDYDPGWPPSEMLLVSADGATSPITEKESLRALPPGARVRIRVVGRTRVSVWKKINLLWWPRNDFEPEPPDWYLPDRPGWWRAVFWWFRNPFQNFGRFVLGVADRDYEAEITRRDDYRRVYDDSGGHEDRLIGWEVGEIRLPSGATLPWVAWGCLSPVSSKFYVGWQLTGFAGLKFNGLAVAAAPLAPALLAWMAYRRIAAWVR